MKYLTAAIKEALRLYPPVPFISRTLDEDIAVSGYRVPAGAYWCALHMRVRVYVHVSVYSIATHSIQERLSHSHH